MIRSSITSFLAIFLSISFSAQVPVISSISGPGLVCSAPATPSSFTAIASNAPYSCSWSVTPAAGVVIGSPGSSVTSISFPNTNNSYTIYCTATNGSGTSAPETLVVTVYETPTVTFSGAGTGFCQGSSTMLSASPTILSASSTLSYNWSPSAGLSSTTGSNVIASPSITTTYTVLLSMGSCTNSAQVTVTVFPKPNLLVTASPATFCLGQTATVTISGGANPTYTVNGMPRPSIFTVSPVFNTNYNVVGLGTEGCSNSTVFPLNVNYPPLLLVTTSPSAICQGQSATVTINSITNASYSISGVPTPSVLMVSPNTSTIYPITGMAPNGCIASSQASISVLPAPTLSPASSHSLLCEGNTATITINGSSNTTYSVNNVATAATFTVAPALNTIYPIIARGSNGCTKTAALVQNVSTCLGINSNIERGAELKIYPNPSNGNFYIKTSESQTVCIINQLGQTVKQIQLSPGKEIPVSGLPGGVYFIVLKHSSYKIIVTK